MILNLRNASIVFFVLLVSACGEAPLPLPFPGAVEPILAPEFTPDLAHRAPVGNIRFDGNIRQDLYRDLAKSLFALRTLPLDHTYDPLLTRIFGLSENTPLALTQWLETRVRVILDFNTLQREYPTDNFNFSAENFGAGLYRLATINNSTPITIDVVNVGRIRIDSPRSGIIRWGTQNGIVISVDYELQYSLNISRTGTLFHEARHSDGHGESAGFPHVACPQGHTFEGILACDNSLNGAYMIQSLFLRSAMLGCRHCSTRGKEWLTLIYVDLLSRILNPANARELDPSPAPELP